ncbi:MAG: N-acetylmuramoyl-L-alanine amidase family protein [Chitinophagaceae bacterium]
MRKIHLFILLISFFSAACTQPIQTSNETKKDFLAKSVGKLPALLYGLGDDRLGGAKMGYIDTGILFKVVDTSVTLWRVQLSKYRSAYVDKVYLKADTGLKQKPYYLTEKMRVFGTDTGYDITTINMDEKLPYRSWMQTEPAAIQIEIFGVQSNTNWITQLPSTLKEIKNVYYRQSEEDVMLVTIELKQSTHWGYSIYYEKNQLVIKVKQQPKKLDIKNIKIAIDAGHGGTNTGAEGNTTHILEKNTTLLFAKQLQKYLKAKGVATVFMTRENDTTLEMKDRILTLQQQNPDLMISIHLNSNADKTVKGCGTFYRHIGFKTVSETILKRMQEIGLAEYGNVGSFNFGLSGPTDFINCLLEVGFLSNIDDERKLANPKFHTQTAIQVYKGIVDWLKLIK